MNQYYPPKKEIYISLAIFILGLAGFSAFVFLTYSKVQSAKTGVISEDSSGGVDKALLIKKEMAELSPQVGILDSFFVHEGQEAQFIEKVEGVARSQGLKAETSSVSVTPDKRDSANNMLNVEIKFEGSWSKVVSFMKALEGMPMAVSIRSIDLNSSGDKGLWSGTLKVSVIKLK